ncbi:MAG TPA: 50S ribosomal protein L2, partial [Candidatus Paceibacterota bacterium]|nr:50S ribosomal protein L2 [Candidatus Paceibacterota bacterium]
MKSYKPTSAGRRGMTVVSYKELLTNRRNAPRKGLTHGGRSTGGRHSGGRTTNFYRGGGNKRTYRVIDFRYDKKDIPAVVESIEYDPFRSGFIALVLYKDGERRYVLAPKDMKKGDEFVVSETAKARNGNRMPLGNVPVGTFVFAIELTPGAGARIARSAGGYAEVVAHDAGYTLLKMPSSEVRRVISTAWATIGQVSNEGHRLVNLGKAGRARYRGRRPKTRGSARNAVDHPHGGGEGRAPRGHRRARTIQGRPTGKGQKTRRPKKHSNTFVVSRRKPGRLMVPR